MLSKNESAWLSFVLQLIWTLYFHNKWKRQFTQDHEDYRISAW